MPPSPITVIPDEPAVARVRREPKDRKGETSEPASCLGSGVRRSCRLGIWSALTTVKCGVKSCLSWQESSWALFGRSCPASWPCPRAQRGRHLALRRLVQTVGGPRGLRPTQRPQNSKPPTTVTTPPSPRRVDTTTSLRTHRGGFRPCKGFGGAVRLISMNLLDSRLGLAGCGGRDRDRHLRAPGRRQWGIVQPGAWCGWPGPARAQRDDRIWAIHPQRGHIPRFVASLVSRGTQIGSIIHSDPFVLS